MASIDGLMPTVPIARSLLSMPSISWLFCVSAAPLTDTDDVCRRSSGRVPLAVRADRAFVGAGHHLHQADDVAAGDGQVLHRLLGEQRADGRGVGLQERRFGGDLHRLGHRADLQPAVDARAVAAGERDPRRLRLEPLQLDRDRVGADRQEGEAVVAGLAGRLVRRRRWPRA